MEFLSTITRVIVDHAWDPIKRHFGYLICYKSKIKKLKKEFEVLDHLGRLTRRRVDEAKCVRADVVDSAVYAWLEDVDIMRGVVVVINFEASVNTRFSANHYKLGRKAAKYTKAIVDLINKADKLNPLSHSRPPPSTTDSLLYNGDYRIFDSRKSHEEKILEALKDEAVHLIGLCGMGGVGKTTFVKEIVKQARGHGLFGEVVMVTSPQNRDVRAGRLADRLTTTDNKVLVILDDLWETLDLSKVGIQLPKMAATCKVVITTRNKDICEKMSCEEIVELETLSDDESWSLLKSRAGIFSVESHTLRDLAWDVARECDGLPLALVVLGTALKNKGPEIWKTVLMQLKQSMEVDLLDVSKEIYKPIQVSFDYINDEAAKSCFFRCCLYPEDWDIPNEELMHMMAGGGLLNVNTLDDAQRTVNALLDNLKCRALLLPGSSKGYVRMHDVVRDAAIQKAK
ncbi:P-loop containing nucleoside triphosphate hydrolase protein [Dioscorea alata]|uniref:P-loop containing nucleoside triphosphate hydrolase protein n=1 Tax=Dioscorea alata TaxID=55571 RepID=A0ACB7UNS7_DIOAL|nr:P-loop containing nucleoside triphosphate hydrolase protein [Dioscorea alata]